MNEGVQPSRDGGQKKGLIPISCRYSLCITQPSSHHQDGDDDDEPGQDEQDDDDNEEQQDIEGGFCCF